MILKLIYSKSAVSDLTRLKEFIFKVDPLAASRLIDLLLKRMELLITFPEIGVPVSKAPKPSSVRDLFVGRYVVRYLISNNLVTILRIWHEKEDR
jgi:plasmid stabilization system protein ParE